MEVLSLLLFCLYPSIVMPNVWEHLYKRNDTTIFAEAVRMTLTKENSPEGDVTIFAPVDEAFKKWPNGALQGVFLDVKLLRDLVDLHVVPGKLYADQLVVRTVETLATRIGEKGTEHEDIPVPLTLQFFTLQQHSQQSKQIKVAGPNYSLAKNWNVGTLTHPNVVTQKHGILHLMDTTLLPHTVRVCDSSSSGTDGCDKLEECKAVRSPGNCQVECLQVEKDYLEQQLPETKKPLPAKHNNSERTVTVEQLSNTISDLKKRTLTHNNDEQSQNSSSEKNGNDGDEKKVGITDKDDLQHKKDSTVENEGSSSKGTKKTEKGSKKKKDKKQKKEDKDKDKEKQEVAMPEKERESKERDTSKLKEKKGETHQQQAQQVAQQPQQQPTTTTTQVVTTDQPELEVDIIDREATSPMRLYRENLPRVAALLESHNVCPCLKLCQPIVPEHYPYGDIISSDFLAFMKRNDGHATKAPKQTLNQHQQQCNTPPSGKK